MFTHTFKAMSLGLFIHKVDLACKKTMLKLNPTLQLATDLAKN